MNRSVTTLNTESEILESLYEAIGAEYKQTITDLTAAADFHESYWLLGVADGLLAAQRILTARMKLILDELGAE